MPAGGRFEPDVRFTIEFENSESPPVPADDHDTGRAARVRDRFAMAGESDAKSAYCRRGIPLLPCPLSDERSRHGSVGLHEVPGLRRYGALPHVSWQGSRPGRSPGVCHGCCGRVEIRRLPRVPCERTLSGLQWTRQTAASLRLRSAPGSGAAHRSSARRISPRRQPIGLCAQRASPIHLGPPAVRARCRM